MTPKACTKTTHRTNQIQ